MPDWMGDGYCDEINANSECGFDGGDCLGLQEGNCDTSLDCAGKIIYHLLLVGCQS